MNGPDVEGVLGRHLIGYESRAYPSYVCLCGWDGAQGDDGSESDGQNDNAEAATAHVAVAVLAEVRAWLESDDALYVAARRESDGLMSVLAALAEQVAQVAPSRVLGEGS